MRIKKIYVLVVLIMICLLPVKVFGEEIGYSGEILDPADTSGYEIHNDVPLDGGGTFHPLTIGIFYTIVIGAGLGIITLGVKKYLGNKKHGK